MTTYQVRPRKQKPKPGVLIVRRSRTGEGYEIINSIGQIQASGFDTEDDALLGCTNLLAPKKP